MRQKHIKNKSKVLKIFKMKIFGIGSKRSIISHYKTNKFVKTIRILLTNKIVTSIVEKKETGTAATILNRISFILTYDSLGKDFLEIL